MLGDTLNMLSRIVLLCYGRRHQNFQRHSHRLTKL